METENKDTDKQNSNTGNWLLKYRKNIFSQFGEDGIIEKIFSILPNTCKWCVEFGAWDGKHISNTRFLLSQCGGHRQSVGKRPRQQKTLPHKHKA